MVMQTVPQLLLHHCQRRRGPWKWGLLRREIPVEESISFEVLPRPEHTRPDSINRVQDIFREASDWLFSGKCHPSRVAFPFPEGSPFLGTSRGGRHRRVTFCSVPPAAAHRTTCQAWLLGVIWVLPIEQLMPRRLCARLAAILESQESPPGLALSRRVRRQRRHCPVRRLNRH